MRLASKLAAVTVAAALFASPALAGKQFGESEASHTGPMFDVLVMRPLGLVAMGVGAVLWLPAAGMTAAIQPSEIGKPTEMLIKKPYRYVFQDPIGSH
ncbi:MAG: hypothetical protein FJ091_13570 [Deltaproteobacteria bacterium]|nr:hypothetical protein [Deltaproteobacteria bacterium]